MILGVESLSMTTAGKCADCTKLWKEYAETIQAQLETLRRSHANALKEEGLALMKSEWQERTSAKKRQKVRKALNEHQVTHLIQELEARQS